MALFNKASLNNSKVFSLGKPEAEAEFNQSQNSPSLKTIFDDTNGVIDAIASGKFIIIGRKGAGKSAIVGYINLNAAPVDEDVYCRIIRPFDNIGNSHLVNELGKDACEILYQWSIISKLIEMILETKRAKYTKEISALEKFYKKYNTLFDLNHFLKDDAEIKTKISVNVLLSVFSGAFSRERSSKQTENQPFYTFIPGLNNVIGSIMKMDEFRDIELIVLFDDLDINFDLANDNDRSKILALIRVAKDLNNDINLYGKVRILLFLRDDVQRKLSGQATDTSKIFGSYGFQLKWCEAPNVPEDGAKIKSIVNKRLKYNFELRSMSYNTYDPWRSYVVENRKGSIFKKLLDYTFYRPRDIINLFLPLDGRNSYTLPLKKSDLKSLLKQFSEKIYEEFNDEISIKTTRKQRELIRSLLSNIVQRTRKQQTLTYQQLCSLIEPPLDSSIIETLYEYDVIGVIDTIGDAHFHFRYSFPTVPLSECTFCVPNIIRLYFDRSTPIHL